MSNIEQHSNRQLTRNKLFERRTSKSGISEIQSNRKTRASQVEIPKNIHPHYIQEISGIHSSHLQNYTKTTNNPHKVSTEPKWSRRKRLLVGIGIFLLIAALCTTAIVLTILFTKSKEVTTTMTTSASTMNISAYWTFDNTTADSFGIYNGQLINNPSFTSSNSTNLPYVGHGQALYLNSASNQSFVVSNPFFNLSYTSFTIEAWIYYSTSTSDRGIFGQCQCSTCSNQCLYLIMRNNRLYIDFTSNYLSGSTTISTNYWYHIAFVYNYETRQQILYLNGVQDGIKSNAQPYQGQNGSIQIGSTQTNSTTNYFFNGYIDNVALTTRAKSSVEILRDASLLAYYSFDSPNPTIDSGPNGLNGASRNTTTVSGRVNEAMRFLGSSSSYFRAYGFYQLPYGVTNSKPFSIAIWINPSSLNNVAIIQMFSSSFSSFNCETLLGIWSINGLRGQIIVHSSNTGQSWLTGPFVTQNAWTHVSLTYSTTNGYTLYVNGVLFGSTSTVSYSSSGTLANLLIGYPLSCSFSSINGYYQGYIDELNIYNRELSQSDFGVVWLLIEVNLIGGTIFGLPTLFKSLPQYEIYGDKNNCSLSSLMNRTEIEIRELSFKAYQTRQYQNALTLGIILFEIPSVIIGPLIDRFRCRFVKLIAIIFHIIEHFSSLFGVIIILLTAYTSSDYFSKSRAFVSTLFAGVCTSATILVFNISTNKYTFAFNLSTISAILICSLNGFLLEFKADKSKKQKLLNISLMQTISWLINIVTCIICMFVQKKVAIKWYTRDTFLFRLVNKVLREENIDDMYKIRLILSDIHIQLVELHGDYLETLLDLSLYPYCLTVYRGQLMSARELDQLKWNIGCFISMNSFLSTSTARDLPLIFSGQGQQRPQLESILFEITIETSTCETAFADIQYISWIPGEEEILITIGAIFRIDSVNQIDNIWIVKLTLCNQKSHGIEQLTDYFPDIKDHQPDLFTFAQFLFYIGDYGRATTIYRRLLSSISLTDKRMPALWNNLAMCLNHQNYKNLPEIMNYFNQGLDLVPPESSFYSIRINMLTQVVDCLINNQKYNEAREVLYQISTLINQDIKEHGLQDEHIIQIARNTMIAGMACSTMGEYSSAHEHFRFVQDIYFNHLPSGHERIYDVYLYKSIMQSGSKGDTIESLESMQRSLELHIASLPPYHPSVADMYNIIAWIYLRHSDVVNAQKALETSIELRLNATFLNPVHLGHTYIGLGYILGGDEGMSYLDKAYCLFKEHLPPNNSKFIQLYMSKAEIYIEKNELERARSYLTDALKIELEIKRSRPGNGLAHIYTLFGKSYLNEGKYALALDYLQKSINLIKELGPHARLELLVAYNFLNLARVYQEQNNLEFALSYYRQSLDIYSQVPLIDKSRLALLHNHIAIVLSLQGSYEKAFIHFQNTLDYRLQYLSFESHELFTSYINLAIVSKHLRDDLHFLEYYQKALDMIYRTNSDGTLEASSIHNEI
ncbi:unnamed protein product, partial [Rotaria sordida]